MTLDLARMRDQATTEKHWGDRLFEVIHAHALAGRKPKLDVYDTMVLDHGNRGEQTLALLSIIEAQQARIADLEAQLALRTDGA